MLGIDTILNNVAETIDNAAEWAGGGGSAQPSSGPTFYSLPQEQGQQPQRQQQQSGGGGTGDVFDILRAGGHVGRLSKDPIVTNPYAMKVTGVGGNVNNLIGQFMDAYNKSNQDSLAQYKNLLASVNRTKADVGGLFRKAFGQLKGYGKSAMQDIADQQVTQTGQAMQDAISRGLSNTSLAMNALRGASLDADKKRLLLRDQIAGQKSNLLTQQAGMNFNLGNLMADSILSRQNQGPDMGLYMQLIQQLAASQAGQSSVGGLVGR